MKYSVRQNKFRIRPRCTLISTAGPFFMGIIFKKPVMILRKQFTELRIQRIMTGAGCFIEVNGIVIFDCLMGESLVQYCIDVFLKNHIFCCIESPEGIYTDTVMTELPECAPAGSADSE